MRRHPALHELETLKKFNKAMLSNLDDELAKARTVAKRARIDLKIKAIHQQLQDIELILNALRKRA